MTLIAAALVVIFAFSILGPLVVRVPRVGALVALLAPALMTAALLIQVPAVTNGGVRELSFAWVPALGVDFALRLDGLSMLFGLLISGIGVLILVYSASYMAGHPQRVRFYGLIFLFMGAMLGIVLSDNLITLFVFWELTSISSFGLISLESERASARAAAAQALFVTGAGALAMLAGLVLLGIEGGSLSISELVDAGSIAGTDFYLPILILILAGAFTKSAQVPFHFWLPNAMEAPTPVSAYLHSATMVKAGVFLLARFSPVLSGGDAWFFVVSGAGAVTMVTGAVLAIAQTDLKRMLAYSTLSVLGSLVFLLGIGTEEAVFAAMVLIAAHAGYKATLFLCAGTIDHATHTRDVRQLGGLLPRMPITAACVLVAGLAMAGVAPLFGFIAKESVYESLVSADRYTVLAIASAVLTNAFMVGVALVVFVRPFLGRPAASTRNAHEADKLLLAGPVLLGVLGIVAGLSPALLDPLAGASAEAVLNEPAGLHLSLWHGFTLALGLSGVTLLLGAGLFLAQDRLRTVVLSTRLAFLSPERTYATIMDGLLRLGEWAARVLQNGYLRAYFSVILGSTVALVLTTALVQSAFRLPSFSPAPRIEDVAVLAIVVAGALMAVATRSRIVAIIGLGISGYGVALIYAWGGAPDLAITQVLVETLIVLMMVFAFYRLPSFARYSVPSTRMRDAVLAVSAGVTVSLLLLATLTVEPDRSLSTRLSELSKVEAYGSNVVNVILVDFRALDTLGEITVLAVAATGILALLRRGRGKDTPN